MKRALALLVAVLPALVSADDVFLKGGGKISGRILERTVTSVVIQVGAGNVTVPLTRVLRIEEGHSALKDYYDRAAKLANDDVAGWKDLAAWAAAQGLATQSREAFERVLTLNPADPDANRGVGRVELGGRWMSESESYRERGYVQMDGQWVTPAERESILRERAAESESVRSERQSQARVREAEARAREAEARARAAEGSDQPEDTSGGIPLWWGGPFGGPPVIVVHPTPTPPPPTTLSPLPPRPRPTPTPDPTPAPTPTPRPPGAVAPPRRSN